MTELTERLKERYFGDDEHPYRTFERTVERHLAPDQALLDAGCGRTAPVLAKYRGRARRLIGVDLVDFPASVPGVELRFLRGWILVVLRKPPSAATRDAAGSP